MSFMVSIVASVIAYTMVVMEYGELVRGAALTISLLAIVITWISFLVAIICLTGFGLSNL